MYVNFLEAINPKNKELPTEIIDIFSPVDCATEKTAEVLISSSPIRTEIVYLFIFSHGESHPARIDQR